MIRGEKELAEKGKVSEWAEEVLVMLDRVAKDKGMDFNPEELRKDALGSKPGMAAVDRRMVEEVAAMRYVLRNLFRLAMEAQKTHEHVWLVGIYSSGCVRLLRLLKIETAESGQLEAYLKDGLQRAIRQVNREMGLVD